MHLRDHVIQASHGLVETAQTVEARAVLARMDGLAQRVRVEEIELVDVGRTSDASADRIG